MSNPELRSLVQRVRAEYDEMPGLALTIPQAARLWRLDAQVARDVMTALVDVHYLRPGRHGFMRTSPEVRERRTPARLSPSR